MITADTITDDQIRATQRDIAGHVFPASGMAHTELTEIYELCNVALHDQPNAEDYPTTTQRRIARSRIAAFLRTRRQPEYPHTLTSEQFAIVSVALDAYLERCADVQSLNELRKLWAFSGPITLNARANEGR